MKSNYKSPTIFNAVDMKLSKVTSGSDSLLLEDPVEGALLPSIALSASLAVVIGRKDIGKKSAAIVKRNF